MTFQGDPYRTLGVAPGASLNEIRSAYRRLAKQFHPDTAGERALPRFLSIQAAYERLVDGEGRLRGDGGAGAAQRPDAWRADPARARASRDAWRTRRSGSGGTAGYRASGPGAGPGAGPRPGATPDPASRGGGGSAHPGSAPGPGSATGPGSASGPGPRTRPGAGERPHARRGPRKATPGSTTYDEAADTPLDPEWDGGAWYGPSSGTYWRLNPREYADPRKHGPEYQARARRASPADGREGPGAPSGPGADSATRPATEATDESGAWEWTGSAGTTTDGGAGAWRSRAWRFEAREGGPAWTPGAEARASRAGERRGGARPAPPGDPPPPDAPPLPDLEAIVRRAFPEHLLRLATGRDRRWRLLLALVAWPPIGYSISGLVSAATGCDRFAATCPEPVPVALLLVQPLIVAALYALPPLLAVAAFASLAALAIAVPVGAVLSVGALPRPAVEPIVLGVIVGTAYAIALLGGAARLRARASRADPGP